jgi:hypothetical protein
VRSYRAKPIADRGLALCQAVKVAHASEALQRRRSDGDSRLTLGFPARRIYRPAVDGKPCLALQFRYYGRGPLMRAICILAAASIVAGCATRSSDIPAAYVSPIQYQSYSCAQLREEALRVSSRAAIAAGAQDQNATNDAVATTAAVILFWPAAFMIKGSGSPTI